MNNRTLHDLAGRFQLSFFAMCRLHTFPWRSLETELKTSSSEVILDILKRTCLHAICFKMPPSVKYRRLFLSELIKRHESTATEPLDELYEALGNVMGAKEEAVCYKTYFLPLGELVHLEENVAMISNGTTGLVTWEAALYLAEWALENPHLFTKRGNSMKYKVYGITNTLPKLACLYTMDNSFLRILIQRTCKEASGDFEALSLYGTDCTVLELGSGSGFTGITVCHACKPSKYIFSDCHQTVLQRLNNNIERNCLTEQDGTVCVREVNWKNVTDEALQRIEANIIIAADVVYDPDVIGYLVRVLAKLLKCTIQERYPEAYICSTIRNPETYNYFKNELEKAGLKHLVLTNPVMQVFPYDRVSPIEIIKIQNNSWN